MAYSITQSDYFKKNQPAKSEELINSVQVDSLPLVIQDFNDSIYESSEPIIFAGLQSQTIEIKFTDIPVKDVTIKAYITDITGELIEDDTTGEYTNSLMVISSDIYAWGASCTITNPNAHMEYCKIVASGYPLKVQGKEIMFAEDSASILENGILKYKLQDNHLIQNRDLAEDIANTILASYVTPRKDILIDWRGDMSLELTDEIEVPEYNKNSILTLGQFNIYKQQTIYDGTLKQTTEGRKI